MKGNVGQDSPSPSGAARLTFAAWLTGIVRAKARARSALRAPTPIDGFDLRAAMLALNGTREDPPLPNGVVELLVDDLGETGRELFDIHDGCVEAIAPGSCVPWTSIAGSLAAWALALGPERDPRDLQLTGEEAMARAVLAALAERRV